MKRLIVVLVAVIAVSCSKSTTAPSATTTTSVATTTTTTTVPATTFTLTGTIVNAATGAPISGATARVADGPNAGRSATSAGNGIYTLTGLTPSGFTVSFSAPNYNQIGLGVTLTGNSVLDARLTPTPLFTRSGVGDSVFDIPSSVSRIRIQGTPGSSCQNFIVRIASRLIVNVILGTCSIADSRTHDGTYLTSGGVAEIVSSSGIQWTFTEVR